MMDKIVIKPGIFKKTLEVPTSKSYANRLLILGAISLAPFKIRSLPQSTDVLNLIHCLKQIGLVIDPVGDGVIIRNSFPECETNQKLILKPGDGGTTTRFLVGLLARGKNTYSIKLSEEMMKRPIDDLINSMQDLNVTIEKSGNILEIKGPYLIKEKIIIESGKSTQFVSSIALALADKKIRVEDKNLNTSKSYLLLTRSLINDFKKGKNDFVIPTDFSSVSYPFALGLFNGEVQINNFSGIDDLQADSKLLKIFKNSFLIENGILKIKKIKKLSPIELDCSDCLDLVPTLSFICSYIKGKSRLKNIEGLIYKETNRLNEITKVLAQFSIPYKLTPDFTLEIFGTENMSDFLEYISPPDHRMAMMTFLFMKYNNGGVIYNANCVSKSFPQFFNIMN